MSQLLRVFNLLVYLARLVHIVATFSTEEEARTSSSGRQLRACQLCRATKANEMSWFGSSLRAKVDSWMVPVS